MTPTPESLDTGETMPVAFGSLFDLARLRIGERESVKEGRKDLLRENRVIACFEVPIKLL